MKTLAVDEDFVPCPVEDGDELFPNGIFVFNVSRILEHVERDGSRRLGDTASTRSGRTGSPSPSTCPS